MEDIDSFLDSTVPQSDRGKEGEDAPRQSPPSSPGRNDTAKNKKLNFVPKPLQASGEFPPRGERSPTNTLTNIHVNAEAQWKSDPVAKIPAKNKDQKQEVPNYKLSLSQTRPRSESWGSGSQRQRPATVSDHPGFAYDPRETLVTPRSPTWRIGTTPRMPPTENETISPGPVYTAREVTRQRSPEYSFPRASQSARPFGRDSSPGPKYLPVTSQTKPRTPSSSFSRTERLANPKPLSPGPQYYPSLTQTKPTSPRARFPKDPMNYNPSTVSPGPVYNVRDKLYALSNHSFPGVAAFPKTARDKQRGPKVWDTARDNPPPNAYNPDFTATKPRVTGGVLHLTSASPFM